MTKKSKFIITKRLYIFIFLFFSIVYCWSADNSKQWTFGAMKFQLNRGQKEDSVTEAEKSMLPKGILENLSSSDMRFIDTEESLDRTLYELKKERTSLYLQLVSETRKRDSLLLNNYSDGALQRKIKAQEKTIGEIKSKLEKNFLNQAKAEKEASETQSYRYGSENENKTELQKYSNLFKNLFNPHSKSYTFENIMVYGSDSSSLVEVSEFAMDDGYESPIFEKEIVDKNINALLTGSFSLSDNYIMVEASVYQYPGAKKIGTVTEIGSSKNSEWICSTLARQLIPILTNAIPVSVDFSVEPSGTDYVIYVDDMLQNKGNNHITLDSGVHTIQFGADGYKTASTSYFFEGNQNYEIQVTLEKENSGEIYLNLKKPVPGTFYGNGMISENTERGARITVNGSPILGEFIAEDGNTAFFYVQKKNLLDQQNLMVNSKIFDRNKYINNRRIWMYSAYSLLITSLLPTFYTYGNFCNYSTYYNRGYGEYEEALKWQKASQICIGITIGCGVFFGYELVRYLWAANSVLPDKAKIDKRKINSENQNIQINDLAEEVEK